MDFSAGTGDLPVTFVAASVKRVFSDCSSGISCIIARCFKLCFGGTSLLMPKNFKFDDSEKIDMGPRCLPLLFSRNIVSCATHVT